MKQDNAKLNRKKCQFNKVVVSFVMLGVMLVVCFLTGFTWLFTTDAFGWFTNNRNPSSNDVDLGMIADYDIEMYTTMDAGQFVKYENKIINLGTMNNIFCGSVNSRNIELKIINNEDKDLYIWWYFGIPNMSYGGVETPYINDGKYYYLGSQLSFTNISVAVDNTPTTVAPAIIPGKNKFLVTTSQQGHGQVNYVGSPISNIGKLDLVEGLTLQAGKTTVITLTLTLVDNGQDQSIYQNFAGSCSRQLYFKLLENNL